MGTSNTKFSLPRYQWSGTEGNVFGFVGFVLAFVFFNRLVLNCEKNSFCTLVFLYVEKVRFLQWSPQRVRAHVRACACMCAQEKDALREKGGGRQMPTVQQLPEK